MESIVTYFSGVGLDFWSLLKLSGILLVGILLLSSITRFVFRKQTILGNAVSSSIAIIFIYVLMVLILTMVKKLHFLITPLPFAVFSQESITFFSFRGSSYASIASEVLSMIILAFLVNLVDSWMPRCKNIFKWTLFRVVTVAIGFALHYLATWLFNRYLPQGIVMYAPAILLALLVIMMLTGALKFLVGLVLTTVNPLIAALYTFFFANIIGKQITKAVVTTGILCGVILLLDRYGITALSLMAGALLAYIPFLLVLIPVWYLVSRE